MEYGTRSRVPVRAEEKPRRMLRSRVRRSFTVEVKSKSRQAPAWPEPPSPSSVDWAALDPASFAPKPADPAPKPADPAPKAAVPAEKPRRILPSLIVAEPEPEPDMPAETREPRLPRVRRVKPPQARPEAPQAERSWSFADIEDAELESPEPVAAQHEAPRPAPVAAPARKLAAPRNAEPALRPGERWKRRLPRSCR